jgi:hypothetical protein
VIDFSVARGGTCKTPAVMILITDAGPQRLRSPGTVCGAITAHAPHRAA